MQPSFLHKCGAARRFAAPTPVRFPILSARVHQYLHELSSAWTPEELDFLSWFVLLTLLHILRTRGILHLHAATCGPILQLMRNVFKRCGAARSLVVHILGKCTCSCIDGSAHLHQHLAHSLSSFDLYTSCPASYCSHRCRSLAQKLSFWTTSHAPVSDTRRGQSLLLHRSP